MAVRRYWSAGEMSVCSVKGKRLYFQTRAQAWTSTHTVRVRLPIFGVWTSVHKEATPEQAEVAPLVVFAVNFVPWQYAVAVTNVRLHSAAVSHSVCLVFGRTRPEFSLSATRQHMHIRRLLLWGGESLSVAIINTSVAAWRIKS